MNFGTLLCAFFIALLGITLGTSNATLATLLISNAIAQLVLFVAVACIPYLRTGRMSYVDIAWPFGVALIGVHVLLLGDGDLVRRSIVGGIYLMIGLRMGIGALTMAKTSGVIFKTEFPRYQYRHMMLEKTGTKHPKFHALAEIMAQGFANMSALALPGFLLAINPNSTIASWEIAGIALWVVAYIFESTADAQKLRFIANPDNKGGVCNIGLWRYSRHPNYFAEWLVWTGLVIATVPSWLALANSETTLVWLSLGIGAVAASGMLYTTLVYLTGAVPAEYYSAQKRPAYKQYQQTTNRFFPWFPKS